MNIQTRIDKIEEARELIEDAASLVDQALNGMGRISDHYQAYGRYGFNQLLNEGNPYDDGLEDLTKKLEEENEESIEAEED